MAPKAKAGGERQKGVVETPELNSVDAVFGIVNSQVSESQQIKEHVTHAKDEICKKTNDAQESVEVVASDQDKIKGICEALAQEMAHVKRKADIIEAKVIVTQNDVAVCRIASEKKFDGDTISTINKINILSEDVAKLAEQITTLPTQLAAFRNSTELRMDSDLKCVKGSFNTLAKWLNENYEE